MENPENGLLIKVRDIINDQPLHRAAWDQEYAIDEEEEEEEQQYAAGKKLQVATMIPTMEQFPLSIFTPISPILGSRENKLHLDESMLPTPSTLDLRHVFPLLALPLPTDTADVSKTNAIEESDILSTLEGCGQKPTSDHQQQQQQQNMWISLSLDELLDLPVGEIHPLKSFEWGEANLSGLQWFQALARWFPPIPLTPLPKVLKFSKSLLDLQLIFPHLIFVDHIFNECFEKYVLADPTPDQPSKESEALIHLITHYSSLSKLEPDTLKSIINTISCSPILKQKLIFELMTLIP